MGQAQAPRPDYLALTRGEPGDAQAAAKPVARAGGARHGDGLGGDGTPTLVPQPRGKSPGWPPGQVRQRRERRPVVKKMRPKAKKPSQTAKQAA